ncbi:MAG: cytochrome PufQ [Pseudomonadota bacterium]
MTDQTSDVPLASGRTRRPPRAEFYVYFAIVFLATLPLAVLTWALHALRSARLPERGPVARAWTQARLITPMIFSAP